MLEHSGGTPLEGAWLTFPGDGTLIVNLNVQSTGQGHASVFPPLVAERLGIPRDKVTSPARRFRRWRSPAMPRSARVRR